ncbi:putative disease resistance protein At1g61300 [Bidens hawaiensis]|uniref:putative disease resistance protein At1g61300 n=1 Tax=Bidens hawaiensis TaxID=980011 RepID=UPI00404B6202
MEAVNYLVGRVVDSLFGVATKEISYMWNSSENIKTLKKEVEKLKAMKETLQRRMSVAEDKGEDTGELVNWINNANVTISEVTKLISEEDESKKTCCNLPFCVNLGNLYHYGKMAKKETPLIKHQQDGERFKDYVFDPLPTPGFTDIYQPKDLENIDTQKSTLKTIIQAVKDEQIVGIVGLGGVGKTTLAQEVYAEMKNQFDCIEFISVSQDIVVEKIREMVQVAARRILNGEKVLIILDDVWEELKLDEVGIPCGNSYMNCKILLTSRMKDACEAMNAKIIKLNPLKEKEAWALFERVVGEREWDAILKRVALDIVKECDGLPLFIQAVGKALKNKEIESWEAALNRLRNPISRDVEYKIKGILQLKLSYDYLKNKVAKSCFLLCSLFPEDAAIDLKRLAYYGLAIGIFDDPDCSMQDAKHIIRGAIDTLKSSFLLSTEKGYKKVLIKMHDLVRDMAMLIASEGNDKFWVRSGNGLREWQPTKHLESYNKVSLMVNKIRELPDHELRFPQLDTFLIQDNVLSIVHDDFFQHMKKLKVLDMSNNKIPSLPRSLDQLKELLILDLSRNRSLREISILGKLTCLEILKLRKTGITDIPKEIGQLTNLRVLDVCKCGISVVTQSVISELIRLEELYVWLKEDGDCRFLKELSKLKSLKILHLRASKLGYIPEDFQVETLIEYKIQDDNDYFDNRGYKRTLRMSKTSFPFTKAIAKLIQASEVLCMSGLEGLDNILPVCPAGFEEIRYLANRECFSKVKEINLYKLNRLKVLWDRPHEYIIFCNLAKIDISFCDSLSELFPVSVAQGLANLREIEIWNCKSMTVVISADDEQTYGVKTGMLPLCSIYLTELPKLESFYSGHSIINYPSLKFIVVDGCPSMNRWSYGDNHIPNIKFEHESNINDYIKARLKV